MRLIRPEEHQAWSCLYRPDCRLQSCVGIVAVLDENQNAHLPRKQLRINCELFAKCNVNLFAHALHDLVVFYPY